MPESSTSESSTTTSTLVVATVAEATEIEGRLPDGRSYRASFSSGVQGEEPDGVFAAIVIDMDQVEFTIDGEECASPCAPVLGITSFQHRRGQKPTYDNGLYEASSGDWTMKISVYQHITEAWGTGIEEMLLESIKPSEVNDGLPAFELFHPLRWATDTEIPLQMEVSYPSFVVRRDCGEFSISCSPSGSVQVIPSDKVYAPAPRWDDNVTVTVSDVP